MFQDLVFYIEGSETIGSWCWRWSGPQKWTWTSENVRRQRPTPEHQVVNVHWNNYQRNWTNTQIPCNSLSPSPGAMSTRVGRVKTKWTWIMWWLIICQHGWAMACPGSWVNSSSGCVCEDVSSLEEISIWTGELSKVEGLPQSEWAPSNPLRWNWNLISAWLSWDVDFLLPKPSDLDWKLHY